MSDNFEDMSMQDAIDSGLAWKLEGSYGRAAMRAIEDGDCMLGHEGHFDAYGSYVPSRYEVEAGTKGSPEYAGRTIDRGEPVDYEVRFSDGSTHVIDSPQLFGVFTKKHLSRFAPVTVLKVV
jgi:hypothetical protein